ncbi:MAG: TIGR03032 family protein [Paracoccaceae bacterium]|nr:TIGR03032 family protein [Paracoccaceae bacterium]MDG1372843.1 TIGR03032 family protein [Paracoccaceae bacterium]
MFFVGLKPDGALSIFERTFPRSMGMGVGRDGALWMSSLFQMWRFRNFLDPGQVKDGFDAVYVPVTGHTTGDIDIHDIHTDELDGPVFVATRFNCLASLTDEGSFKVRWKPPFIDRIAAEDGVPKYVTCVAKTNVLDGWREHRREGGMVLDIESGEAVATGLSMPHSPRLHNGKLWLIQSGTGEFGHIDMKTGKFEAACFLQGFARGVTFLGDHAIVGVSRPRQERTFEGLELSERLEKEGVSPVCGLAVVNLSTGDIEHRLTIEGVVEELYDVLAIPGVIRPMALGFKSDEIRFAVRPVE